MPPVEVSLLLAGDALVTRPWSHVDDPAFLELVETVRSADVAIANLETVIHEFKGYAQADSGGTYMHSAPTIASELKWAGFDLLAHANNHTFDYGSTGVIETHEHAGRAGLVIAGSGRDLQEARAPRYVEAAGARVALVAMASTFVPYGLASLARPDLHGRPGVNPLPFTQGRVDRVLGRLLGHWQLEERDRHANLAAVAEAARHAQVVVASVHAHRQGPWLDRFARALIDQGAHVVHVHGPHQVGAVAIYRERPIFYSLGSLAYEVEYITRLPSDAYERLHLGDTATARDLHATPGAVRRVSTTRATFEGCVATVTVSANEVSSIRLDPIDLQFDADGGSRGRPRRAAAPLGRQIIDTVSCLSRRYGTRVQYDASGNCGNVARTRRSSPPPPAATPRPG